MLPCQNGIDNSQTCLATDITDDVGQLHVHFRERMLHVLNLLAGGASQNLALPQVAAQYPQLLLGSEGIGKQSISVQPLHPLAVWNVSLLSRHVFGITRIDHDRLEASVLEQIIEHYPVVARGF